MPYDSPCHWGLAARILLNLDWDLMKDLILSQSEKLEAKYLTITDFFEPSLGNSNSLSIIECFILSRSSSNGNDTEPWDSRFLIHPRSKKFMIYSNIETFCINYWDQDHDNHKEINTSKGIQCNSSKISLKPYNQFKELHKSYILTLFS